MAPRASATVIAALTAFCWAAAAGGDASAAAKATDSPRGAFKAFFIAVMEGRPDDVAPLCAASDADSQLMVKDFRDLAAAIGELRAAASAQFGADAVDTVGPRMASAEDIDAMTQTINGDRADLVGDNIGPAELIKSDGRWKLDIAALRHGPDVPADAHEYFSALAKAVRRTAQDVTARKFDSAQSAGEAMAARQEMIGNGEPTTQTSPTTQP